MMAAMSLLLERLEAVGAETGILSTTDSSKVLIIREWMKRRSPPPLLYLFGLPRCGKNYVGELLASQYGYLFFDADKVSGW